MEFSEVKGHSHLTAEIVTRNAYKVNSLIFPPDVIFDIGANIGVFTHYVHSKFPNAQIVAVEPHPANFAALQKYLPPDRVTAINKGIGNGILTRYPDLQSTDGNAISSGEGYHSDGFGYKTPSFGDHPFQKDTGIDSVLLDALYAEHVEPGQRLAIKIDCEGAENLLFAHAPSVAILQKADFVAMELHHHWGGNFEADSGGLASDGHRDEAIASVAYKIFAGTHRADSEPPMFYAWRKPDDEPILSRSEFGRLLKERGLLGNAAEIGVATGLYSRQILNWGVKNLLLVDPWKEQPPPNGCGISDEAHEENYQICLASIGEDIDRVTLHRMMSVDAAALTPDNSLDFCYIDANHRTQGITVDLPTWWAKVRPGGILAGHDYLQPALGVNKAVKEFAAKHDLRIHLVIEHQMDASFYLEKPQ